MHGIRKNDSRATFIGGRNGMVIGAVFGALTFAVLTFILDMLEVGAGGPGLTVMAGALGGGLFGTLFGALSARAGGRRSYEGSERREIDSPHEGADRRSAWLG